ncbi:hypothetical protein Tco_0408986 [Tanacetum coccineum]
MAGDEEQLATPVETPQMVSTRALPDEHQLKFHGIEDAKELWAAIKNRFGGNDQTKKMQKNVLKQHFENFSVSNTEGLDKAYDRFQRLISQLEVHGAPVTNEDANHKFLRALPSAWSNIALIMRNHNKLDTLDLDDLYNNLKVYEADIKGSSGSSSNSQNVDFLSLKNASSTDEAFNTDNDVSTAAGYKLQGQSFTGSKPSSSSSYTDEVMFSFFANQSNSPQLDSKDLEQINNDDMEEINLKWQVAMLTMRWNVSTAIEDDILLESVEHPRTKGIGATMVEMVQELDMTRAIWLKKNQLILLLWPLLQATQVLTQSAKDKTGLGYGDQMNENDFNDCEVNEKVSKSVFDSHSSDGDDIQANDRFKKVDGYHAVPPPLTGNYMPSKANLSFAGLDDSVYKLDSDSDDDSSFRPVSDQPKHIPVKINYVKPVENVKCVGSVQCAESDKQVEKPRISTQSPKVERKDWNGLMAKKLGLGYGFTKKACFVCGSLSHLIRDCTFHEDRMAKKSMMKNYVGQGTGQRETRPVWNNFQRINHQNKFVPSAVLARSGKLLVSAAKKSSSRAAVSTSPTRLVNTATHKRSVNISNSRRNTFHKSHSPIKRSFYKLTAPKTSISKEKVNIVRVNSVNTVGQKAVSAVKENRNTVVNASSGCTWRHKMPSLVPHSNDNSGSWTCKRVDYIDPQCRLKSVLAWVPKRN